MKVDVTSAAFGLALQAALAMLATAVGAAVTWLVSRRYYQASSLELRDESKKLRRKVDMVLRALEEAGLIELNRDASGEIAGIVVTGAAKLGGKSSMTAKAEVIRRKEPPDTGGPHD